MKQGVLLLVFALSLHALSLAQAPKSRETGLTASVELSQEIDKIFAPLDGPTTPGAAVILVKDGAVFYERGYGSANLEYGSRITPATVFDIASVSKQFTGLAIAMLIEQGRIALDADIRTYLPEMPDFGKTITVRHLLYHTSGLRDWVGALLMAGWRWDDVITLQDILRMVQHQRELNFDPGEWVLYSNTGYNLLAQIVATVTGRFFQQWAAEHIFTPLGMRNTHVHNDYTMVVQNLAYSYAPVAAGKFKKFASNLSTVGSSSIFTTVEDLAKWIINFEDGHVGGQTVLERVHTPGRLNNGEPVNYGYGLAFTEHKGLKIVAHEGAWAGYRTILLRVPAQRFAVAILSNNAATDSWALALKVVEVCLAEQLQSAPSQAVGTSPQTVEIDPATYDAYVGKYLLEPGLIMSVMKEKDRLMLQATEQPKAELFSASETTFFLKVIDAHITFHRDERGNVTGLTVHWRGRDMPAKRMQPPILSASQFAEFVGDYYSDELGTTYTIRLQSEQLVAQHRRHEDIPLTPLDADWFSGNQWWLQHVHFTRDNDKRVTGLRFTGGRALNVRFDKQAH